MRWRAVVARDGGNGIVRQPTECLWAWVFWLLDLSNQAWTLRSSTGKRDAESQIIPFEYLMVISHCVCCGAWV